MKLSHFETNEQINPNNIYLTFPFHLRMCGKRQEEDIWSTSELIILMEGRSPGICQKHFNPRRRPFFCMRSHSLPCNFVCLNHQDEGRWIMAFCSTTRVAGVPVLVVWDEKKKQQLIEQKMAILGFRKGGMEKLLVFFSTHAMPPNCQATEWTNIVYAKSPFSCNDWMRT